jgi:hypothetical protein
MIYNQMKQSGKFSLAQKHLVEHRELKNLNANASTLTLGSSVTFKYVIPKYGKYPVMTDWFLRYKCTNSCTGGNDTYSWISIWNVVDTVKFYINDREVLMIKDNLSKEARVFRMLDMPEELDTQHLMYKRSRAAGKSFHSTNAIAQGTTSHYHFDSVNDVTNLFEDFRCCNGVDSIGFELTLVSGDVQAALSDSLLFDNSTDSEVPKTYFSLTSFDCWIEMSYYGLPQTSQSIYEIPCVKYSKKDFSGTTWTTDYIDTASQSFTIDLQTNFHNIKNIKRAWVFGRDDQAAVTGVGYKQYLSLGIIDHYTLRIAGQDKLEIFNQYHMLEALERINRTKHGRAPWLMPDNTLVSNEEVPFVFIDFTDRVRHIAANAYVHDEGLTSNQLQKVEIILSNGSLTDSNCNRMRCILESSHKVVINKLNGAVAVTGGN